MKKTNTFLLALVAVLCCLVAVACDKDPSYPPQETIDPIEAGANMGISRSIIVSYMLGDFIEAESPSCAADLFPSEAGEENVAEMFFWLTAALKGNAYSALDDFYIEYDGRKYFPDPASSELGLDSYEIANFSIGSYSNAVDETTGMKTIEVKDLSYTFRVSSPFELDINVRISARLSINATYREGEEQGKGEWIPDFDDSYTLELTVDGVEKPTLRFDASEMKYHYGSYVRSLMCTVTFDSCGGSAVPSQSVKMGEKVKKPENPTKDETVGFIEWRTKEGEAFNFRNEIYEDITLYAFYYLAPTKEIETKAFAMLSFADIATWIETKEARIENGTASDIFYNLPEAPERLFEMMLHLVGKRDGFFESAYLEIDGNKYYSSRDDKDNGLVSGTNYTIEDDSLELCAIAVEDGNVATYEIKNMKYTVRITEPVEYSVTVSFDCLLKLHYDKRKEPDRFEFSMTLDGTELPFLKGYLVDLKLCYGDYIVDIPQDESLKPRNLSLKEGVKLSSTYTGFPIEIPNGWFSYEGNGSLKIEYKNVDDSDFSYTEDAPVDAGEYRVRATVRAMDEYAMGNIVFTYVIEPSIVY